MRRNTHTPSTPRTVRRWTHAVTTFALAALCLVGPLCLAGCDDPSTAGTTSTSSTAAQSQPQSAAQSQPQSAAQATAISVTVTIDGTPAGWESAQTSTVSLDPDATVLDALLAAQDDVTVSSGMITSIAGLKNGSHGFMSGWMFMVNGEFPLEAAGDTPLASGDAVVWSFYVEPEGSEGADPFAQAQDQTQA